MNIIYDSVLFNPYQNIAFERQLSELDNDIVTLFLWQNDNCVVIGRNQNPLAECNLEYLKDNHVALSRRYSGGGAVFHDLGNINYTLVMKEKTYDLEKAKRFLLKAFEYLNLNVVFSGRNDMTIEGSKFSGQAYYSHKEMYVIHGTLMLDLNIETLGKCLTPSKKKLESKGIKSVKSRVINLKEVNPELSTADVKNALIRAFKFTYGESQRLLEVDESRIDLELINHLQSEEWLYSQSPRYNIEIEKGFSFGNVVLQLEIKNNRVNNAKVFTDSLRTSWITLEEKLKGRTYNENDIWEFIGNHSQ